MRNQPAVHAPWPAHDLLTGSVPAGGSRSLAVDVLTGGHPLGLTLQTVNGGPVCVSRDGSRCGSAGWDPELDATLLDPAGHVVVHSRCGTEAASSTCASGGRSATLGVASAAPGRWTVRVTSHSGPGSYRVDVFGGMSATWPAPPASAVPPVPSSLVATARSATQVRVTWAPASPAAASPLTGLQLERCRGFGCSTFTPLASTPPGATAFTDTGLVAGALYRYRLRAVTGLARSAWSGTAAAMTPRR